MQGTWVSCPMATKAHCHNEDPAQLPSPPPQKKILGCFNFLSATVNVLGRMCLRKGTSSSVRERPTQQRYLPKGIAKIGRGCEQVIHVLSLYAETGAQLIPQVEIQLWGRCWSQEKRACAGTRGGGTTASTKAGGK